MNKLGKNAAAQDERAWNSTLRRPTEPMGRNKYMPREAWTPRATAALSEIGPDNPNRDRADRTRVTSRQTPERRALTARIKARDLNTCQKCGGQGTEVHHLFKVGSHKDLELVDDNCVLLCAWCHRLNPDAAHKGNETAYRHWRARNYPPFAAIFQSDIDRPTLDARNAAAHTLSEGGEA